MNNGTPRTGNAVIAIILLLAAVGLVAVGFLVFGSSATTVTRPVGPAGAGTASVPEPEPLLEEWQDPAAVIVLTGEQHGYIEPCRLFREPVGWFGAAGGSGAADS